MTNLAKPILERGAWHELDAAARDDLTTRGINNIFDPKLRESVLTIIEDVRENGDAALVRALAKFDKVEIAPENIKVSAEEFAAARAAIKPELLTAIRDSIAHVRRFNEKLMEHGNWMFETAPGVFVGEKATPIESAGLFVPSGKGSYPSVLIQLATPAVVAGVKKIAVVVPPVAGEGGRVDDAVLVVASELGITDVFRVNGPAGIAALAFGTESIPKVRKVCGPGSPPVASAQIEVQRFGTCAVMLLGPSESLILADDSADVVFLAADLLNEAEHGPDSSSVFVTDSQDLLDAVQAEVARQVEDLPEPRRSYALSSLGVNGGAVLVRDMVEGAEGQRLRGRAHAARHPPGRRHPRTARRRRRDPARPGDHHLDGQLCARHPRLASHQRLRQGEQRNHRGCFPQTHRDRQVHPRRPHHHERHRARVHRARGVPRARQRRAQAPRRIRRRGRRPRHSSILIRIH